MILQEGQAHMQNDNTSMIVSISPSFAMFSYILHLFCRLADSLSVFRSPW